MRRLEALMFLEGERAESSPAGCYQSPAANSLARFIPITYKQSDGSGDDLMYKIIGGDRKEYGPVSVDELRHWIAEGRLNGQSLALAEGSVEWRTLSSFPEFAEALRAQAG